MALRGTPPPPPRRFFEIAGVPLHVSSMGLEHSLLQMDYWEVKTVRSFIRKGARVFVVSSLTHPPTEFFCLGETWVSVQAARDRNPTQAGFRHSPAMLSHLRGHSRQLLCRRRKSWHSSKMNCVPSRLRCRASVRKCETGRPRCSILRPGSKGHNGPTDRGP